MRLQPSVALTLIPLFGACRSTSVHPTEGWRRLELRDFGGALSSFEQQLASEDSAEIRAGQGFALTQLRRYPEAERAYAEALERAPGKASFHLGLGIARLGQGNTRGAVAAFDQALRFEPDSGKAHFNRGLAHQAAGDDELALADFTRALELDPRFAPAYESRGVLLARSGSLEAAIQDFDTAARLDPALASAHANRAAALYAQGEVQQALISLNTAIRIDRSQALFYVNRGRIYLDLDRPTQASKDFEQALALSPEDARIWGLLAGASRDAGQDELQQNGAFEAPRAAYPR